MKKEDNNIYDRLKHKEEDYKFILDNSLILFDEDTGDEYILKEDIEKFLEQFNQ